MLRKIGYDEAKGMLSNGAKETYQHKHARIHQSIQNYIYIYIYIYMCVCVCVSLKIDILRTVCFITKNWDVSFKTLKVVITVENKTTP